MPKMLVKLTPEYFLLNIFLRLASSSCTVVQQLTGEPTFKGSNPAIAGHCEGEATKEFFKCNFIITKVSPIEKAHLYVVQK